MAGEKIALVTGGGTGVGKATALGLAKAGYTVVVVGRRVEPLQETVKEIEAAGGKGLALSADVGDPKAVATLFETVEKTYGRLDVLFNNAGMGTPAVPMEELTYEQWSAVVAVNLTGPFLCTQQAMKLMKKQKPHGGRIINNGSISAHTPRPFSSPYTSTKHAITGLTKATALDGRPHDICCGQIDIGNAATPMTARMAGGVLQPNLTMMPEPTMAAENVANAIVYMSSLPLDANVLTMTVMATQMPYVGRG